MNVNQLVDDARGLLRLYRSLREPDGLGQLPFNNEEAERLPWRTASATGQTIYHADDEYTLFASSEAATMQKGAISRGEAERLAGKDDRGLLSGPNWDRSRLLWLSGAIANAWMRNGARCNAASLALAVLALEDRELPYSDDAALARLQQPWTETGGWDIRVIAAAAAP